MIMSVHGPLSQKRTLLTETVSDEKRRRAEPDCDAFSGKMYALLVKSAMDAMEKINSLTVKINLPLAHKDSISLPNFEIVLRSLSVNVARLDNAPASALISAILRYDWLNPELAKREGHAEFLQTYANFVSVLVSSLPKHLYDVLKKLVRGFSHVHGDSYPHHRVLKSFVAYYPTSVSSLPLLLVKNFPHHMSSSARELTNYVRNTLEMVVYCPDLRFSVWQMAVQCCIRLDVELQNDLDDLDDDCIEALIDGTSDEIEDNNVIDSGIDAAPNDESGITEVYAVSSTRNIKRQIHKLDSVMELLFSATKTAFSTAELDSGDGVDLFNTLTSLFKTHILATHFTKLIQFLLFRVSQDQPELADSFLVILIDIAFNPAEITEKRLKALQYLSSYIARAKNLTRHQVVFIVSYLIGWVTKYMDEREHEVNDASSQTPSAAGGMERFKMFYATFQALLYIFCFRHQQLSRPAEEIGAGKSEWECDLDRFFQRAIIVKFNPLKYCDETVVFIFAKLATKLNLCYCYSIIEHNKRERVLQSNSSLPSSVGNFRHKQEFLDLEAYFPFDPMVLPMCKKLVRECYIEWSEVNPEENDDDDEIGCLSDDSGDDEDMDAESAVEDSDEGLSSDDDDE